MRAETFTPHSTPLRSLVVAENRPLTVSRIALVGLAWPLARLLGQAVLSLLRGNYLALFLSLGILALTMLPAIIRRSYQVYLPLEFDFITILFVFGSLFLGEFRSYYARFWWWDLLLHTSAGFLMGLVGFILVYVLNREQRTELTMSPVFIGLFSFTFAMTLGVLWEIFEYAMDVWFQADMQWGGLEDTMWDLILDAASAAFISVLGYGWLRSGRESFLERWIHRFVTENPGLFGEEPFRERVAELADGEWSEGVAAALDDLDSGRGD